MPNSPLVSIIVPFYNTEGYIRQCIDSLLGQTIDDFELILVDDWSTDSSPEIARSYALEDDRIRIVTQHNQGLSASRNAGLAVAQGTYVAFIDSDDWVEPEMCAKLLETATGTGAQVVTCGTTFVYPDGTKKDKIDSTAGRVFAEDEFEEVRPAFYGPPNDGRSGHILWRAVCSALFDRAFLMDNGLAFVDAFAEDVLFCVDYSRHVSCFTSIPDRLTDYRCQRPGSIMNTLDKKRIDRVLEFLELLGARADAEDPSIKDKCRQRLYARVFECYRDLFALMAASSLPESELKEMADRLYGFPLFEEACSAFPYRRAPLLRALFNILIAHRCTGPLLKLLRIRQRSA